MSLNLWLGGVSYPNPRLRALSKVISGVFYLINLLRTIQILLNIIGVHKLALSFALLKTVSLFLIFLVFIIQTFIPHLQYSFIYPFPLIIITKTRPIASDSHLNTKAFKTMKLHFFRRAWAANQHGAPVPISTAVPPTP